MMNAQNSVEQLTHSLSLLPPEIANLALNDPVNLKKLLNDIEAKRQSEIKLAEACAYSDKVRSRCMSLAGFVREAWAVLEPAAKYIHNWHINAICKHLEAVTDGRITRLLINVPPGSMKSLIVSVLWPAWEWAVKGLRSYRYLTTAFNDIPVTRDSRKMRDLICSEWFQTLWPELTLTRRGETSFANNFTGTREGVPFGSLTSQRGDRLLVDDPHSTEKAESDTDRATTTRRFREGAQNRLNDARKSAIIVIMQRLHEDDVSGTILKLGLPFVHLMIPMEFETARKCVVRLGPPPLEGEEDQRPIFWQDPRTEEGELLDPVRFPRAECDALRFAIGEYGWAGQYQQRPAPRDGGLFDVSQIGTVDLAPAGRAVRGWDIAGSKRKTSPYTVGVKLVQARDGTVCIADVRRKRDGILASEQLIVTTANHDGTQIMQSIPQDPGSAGLSQKAHLGIKLAGTNFRFSREQGDKQDRAIPISSMIAAGLVTMVKAPWNAEFIEELRGFPNGSYKDQVDALSRAYHALITGAGKSPGAAPEEVEGEDDDSGDDYLGDDGGEGDYPDDF